MPDATIEVQKDLKMANNNMPNIGTAELAADWEFDGQWERVGDGVGQWSGLGAGVRRKLWRRAAGRLAAGFRRRS